MGLWIADVLFGVIMMYKESKEWLCLRADLFWRAFKTKAFQGELLLSGADKKACLCYSCCPWKDMSRSKGCAYQEDVVSLICDLRRLLLAHNPAQLLLLKWEKPGPVEV